MDRGELVHALTHTAFVFNDGTEATPVGGHRPLSATEANDVADLVFGPAPHRMGSPFADAADDGALHAVERTASGDVVPFSASSPTTTPSTGFDTCRHQHAQRVHPHYEIQESGYAPED